VFEENENSTSNYELFYGWQQPVKRGQPDGLSHTARQKTQLAVSVMLQRGALAWPVSAYSFFASFAFISLSSLLILSPSLFL
jgi:hypothetical protein